MASQLHSWIPSFHLCSDPAKKKIGKSKESLWKSVVIGNLTILKNHKKFTIKFSLLKNWFRGLVLKWLLSDQNLTHIRQNQFKKPGTAPSILNILMNLEMISEVDFKWWSIMALIHSSSQCQLKAKKRKNIPPPAPYTNGSFFQLSLLWGQMKPYRFGIELIPSKFIRNNLSKKGKKLRISITTCFLNITKSKMRKKRQNQMPISTSIFKNTLQIFENL